MSSIDLHPEVVEALRVVRRPLERSIAERAQMSSGQRRDEAEMIVCARAVLRAYGLDDWGWPLFGAIPLREAAGRLLDEMANEHGFPARHVLSTGVEGIDDFCAWLGKQPGWLKKAPDVLLRAIDLDRVALRAIQTDPWAGWAHDDAVDWEELGVRVPDAEQFLMHGITPAMLRPLVTAIHGLATTGAPFVAAGIARRIAEVILRARHLHHAPTGPTPASPQEATTTPGSTP